MGSRIENEYIIINKTSIQKRIEELEKEKDEAALSENEYAVGYFTGQIHALYELISNSSQSTPLIPEIEKAFDASKITTGMNQRNQFAYKYKNSKDYIANLKIDI